MPEISNNKYFFTNYHIVIFGFVILTFGFDFIDKIEIFYGFGFVKLNRILKAIFLTYSVVFVLTHVRYVYKNLKVLSVITIVLSIVYLLKNNFSERYLFEYLRYIFALLTFPLFYYTYLNKDHDLSKKLYNFFKWLISINAVLILIGVLLEVKIFKTYQYGGRFGYNGIILSQGFTPFFYLCATIMFWVFKDKKMLLLLLILCVLSGIKGVYFAEFLILSLLVLSNQKLNRSSKFKALVLLSAAFIALLVGLLMMPTFKQVFESKGLLSAIFSFRNDNALEVFNQITSNNYNVLIGTLELKTVRLELQILDIILFFGIIGLIAYIVFLFFLNKSFVKSNTSKAFFITILSLSVLSGNLFYIPLSSVLMLLVLIALYNNKNVK